jgi:hypothetical protein
MADITTTIGADLSALDADLRQAVSKQERYASIVRMIDERIARDAVRNATSIQRASAAAERQSINFLHRFTTTSGEGAKAMQALGLRALSGAAAVALATRAIGRSADAYGKEFTFAGQRLAALDRQSAALGSTLRRDLFGAFVDGRSVLNETLGLLEKGREAAARFAASYTIIGLGSEGLFNPGAIRAGEAAAARAERMDREAASRAAAAGLGRSLAESEAMARGDRFGAARARVDAEFAGFSDRVGATAGLLQADRQGLLEAASARADREIERLRAERDAERAERDLRRRGLAADDGSDFGRLQSSAFLAAAEAQARARNLLGQPLTSSERAEEIDAIRRGLSERVGQLQREATLSAELLRLDRERAEALGLDGDARRDRLSEIDEERRRAEARAAITDPRRLGSALAGIDAEADARRRDAEAAGALDQAREADRRARSVGDARDTLESLRIEGMRAAGKTREAEQAEIRLRFGGIEQRFRETLGEDAGPYIEKLGAAMAEALARAGKEKSSVVSAPTGAGGFAGVRQAIGGGASERVLRKIEENTRNTVSFVVR